MARPRTPTHLLELSGAYKRNPQRKKSREGEPRVAAALGAKVEKLKPLESACWDRIVALAPEGVLKNCDEAIVEVTSRLWAKIKTGKFKAADISNLRLCLQQLGMTPASRAAVKVPVEKPKNRFADI